MAEVINDEEGRRIKVTSYDVFNDEYKLPGKLAAYGQQRSVGGCRCRTGRSSDDNERSLADITENLRPPGFGEVIIENGKLFVKFETRKRGVCSACSHTYTGSGWEIW
jgi:hypothetical protein